MAFSLTAEQTAVREAVREFGENEIEPLGKECDREKRYPAELMEQAAQYDLIAPEVPEKYGGAGMDSLTGVVVTEELWRADPGIGSAIGSRGFGSSMIQKYGDEWMKEEWLPKITSGESACASAISEPAHGSNVAGIETYAERDADGWVLNGNKMWITNGTVADVMVVMAKTDPDAGHEASARSSCRRIPTACRQRKSTTSSASARQIWPKSSSTTFACPRRTSSARRALASTS